MYRNIIYKLVWSFIIIIFFLIKRFLRQESELDVFYDCYNVSSQGTHNILCLGYILIHSLVTYHINLKEIPVA